MWYGDDLVCFAEGGDGWRIGLGCMRKSMDLLG